MKNFLSKILNNGNNPPQDNDLEAIRAFSNNIEVVPGGNEYPDHLIAHGLVVYGNSSSEINTAINTKEDNVEFTTNIGQVPYTNFGGAIVEQLNHWFDGKFVTFYTDQRDRLDLVYATSIPDGWVNPTNLQEELQDHANVKVAVSGVLNDAFFYKPNNPQIDYPSALQTAQDIVESRLSLHRRLNDDFLSNQYIPLPQPSSEDNDI